MVTPPNRHRYIVTMSQYNDATAPILFSDSTTLSAITVEMNNAWKRGETLTKRKREPYTEKDTDEAWIACIKDREIEIE